MFELSKKDFPELQLHIIGMSKTEFTSLPNDVYCYGYLDKGNENDRKIYYSLLEKAKVFINTTSKWGAFSATIESMYLYTPIIVTPYTEFVETFGEKINFGYYCNDNTISELYDNIKNFFISNDYREMCINANYSVKDFTWDNYTERMIEIMNERKKI